MMKDFKVGNLTGKKSESALFLDTPLAKVGFQQSLSGPMQSTMPPCPSTMCNNRIVHAVHSTSTPSTKCAGRALCIR
jgi:hypothetical protein